MESRTNIYPIVHAVNRAVPSKNSDINYIFRTLLAVLGCYTCYMTIHFHPIVLEFLNNLWGLGTE
jgi:hypothetical protein